MKKIFSDRNLLWGGLLLLFINVGYLAQKKGYFARHDAAPKTNTTVIDRTITDQILRSGLIVPLLYWQNDLLVTSENGQQIPFNSLIGPDNKLILRFDELSCNVCVDREVEHLKKFAATYGSDCIIVLTTYNNIRDLIAFKRINQLAFQVYNIDPAVFSPEQAGGTFLFVANATSRAYMPFLPDKENGELSAAYYSFIAPLFVKK